MTEETNEENNANNNIVTEINNTSENEEPKDGDYMYDTNFNIFDEIKNIEEIIKRFIKISKQNKWKIEPKINPIFIDIFKVINSEVCGYCKNKEAVCNLEKLLNINDFKGLIPNKYICENCRNKEFGKYINDEKFTSCERDIFYDYCSLCKQNQSVMTYTNKTTNKKFNCCSICTPVNFDNCNSCNIDQPNLEFIREVSNLIFKIKEKPEYSSGEFYLIFRALENIYSGDNSEHAKTIENKSQIMQILKKLKQVIDDDLAKIDRSLRIDIENNKENLFLIKQLDNFEFNIIGKNDKKTIFKMNIDVKTEDNTENKYILVNLPKELVKYIKESFDEIINIITLSGLKGQLSETEDDNKKQEIKNKINKIKLIKKENINFILNFKLKNDDSGLEVNIKVADLMLNKDNS